MRADALTGLKKIDMRNCGMLPDGWQTYRGFLICSAFFDVNSNAYDD